jgi:hypothetical protein
MQEIGTSVSMSGDGKQSVATWPKLPRPSSDSTEARSSERLKKCPVISMKQTS